MQAIFLHSPDSTFAPIGAVSKIPYEKYFTQYKRIILEGEGSPKIAALYKFFNEIVFGATKSDGINNGGNSPDKGGDGSDIDDILEHLRMTDVEDDCDTEVEHINATHSTTTARLQTLASIGTQLLVNPTIPAMVDGASSLMPCPHPPALATISEAPQAVDIGPVVSTIQESHQAPKSRKKGKERASDVLAIEPRRRSTRKAM